MPNFTPVAYKRLYEIYPGKRCIGEPTGTCGFCTEEMVRSIGRTIDHSRGDAVRIPRLALHGAIDRNGAPG